MGSTAGVAWGNELSSGIPLPKRGFPKHLGSWGHELEPQAPSHLRSFPVPLSCESGVRESHHDSVPGTPRGWYATPDSRRHALRAFVLSLLNG
jgi:hypothetical protein